MRFFVKWNIGRSSKMPFVTLNARSTCHNSLYCLLPLIPALFMTMVCGTFIIMDLCAKTGLTAHTWPTYLAGAVVTAGALGLFFVWKRRWEKKTGMQGTRM
jgi:hypothetical protein